MKYALKTNYTFYALFSMVMKLLLTCCEINLKCIKNTFTQCFISSLFLIISQYNYNTTLNCQIITKHWKWNWRNQNTSFLTWCFHISMRNLIKMQHQSIYRTCHERISFFTITKRCITDAVYGVTVKVNSTISFRSIYILELWLHCTRQQ